MYRQLFGLLLHRKPVRAAQQTLRLQQQTHWQPSRLVYYMTVCDLTSPLPQALQQPHVQNAVDVASKGMAALTPAQWQVTAASSALSLHQPLLHRPSSQKAWEHYHRNSGADFIPPCDDDSLLGVATWAARVTGAAQYTHHSQCLLQHVCADAHIIPTCATQSCL